MTLDRSTAAWATLVLVGAADIATTHVGLSVGLVEGNPIVAPFLETWGSWFLVAFKSVVILGAYAATRWLPAPWPAVTAELIAAVWMFAVGWNLSLTRPAATAEPVVTGVVFAGTAAVVFSTTAVTEWLTKRTEPYQSNAGM